MSPTLLTFLILAATSLVFSALLIREYLSVTAKRRRLIAALGGSGRAVPFFKRTLMMTYVISTVLWVIALAIFFFHHIM